MNENRIESVSRFLDGLSAAAGTGTVIWDFLTREGALLLGCQAASFFETDESKRTLTFRACAGPAGPEPAGKSLPYQGVAGECAQNRQALLVNDAANDPRFSDKVDSGTGFKTRCILALPALAGGNLLGVTEFLNASSGAFSQDDLLLARTITALASREVYIKKLEATVKQLNLKGESTINNLSGGFIGADLEGKVIFFNPKAMEIFETREDYLGRNVITLFQLSPDIVNAIGAVLKQNKTVRRQEFKCSVNGKEKLIGYSSINIKGVDGGVIGAGVIFQDITNI